MVRRAYAHQPCHFPKAKLTLLSGSGHACPYGGPSLHPVLACDCYWLFGPMQAVDEVRVYRDSKTIVDQPLKAPPAEVGGLLLLSS